MTESRSVSRAGDSVLGSPIGSIAAVSKKSAVAGRFYLQSLARELLPDEAVCSCCREIAPVRDDAGRWVSGYGLEIRRSLATGQCRYANFKTCKSVWLCPVCSWRIAEGRRDEMQCALAEAEHQGLHLVMVTLTLRHHKGDSLPYLLDALIEAYRSFTAEWAYKELKTRYEIIGTIRALEVTYAVATGNGWHPHNHVLVFMRHQLTADELIDFTETVKTVWNRSLARHGRDASWERGADVETANSYIAEYIAKYGRDPVERRWGVESELTMTPVKKASAKGLTPFQMLSLYGDDLGGPWGDLFVEYAKAFKGRNQLYWSPGLKELLKVKEDSDADLLAESLDDTEYSFAILTPEELRALLAQSEDIRGELLAVGKLGAASFRRYLSVIGINPLVYDPPS